MADGSAPDVRGWDPANSCAATVIALVGIDGAGKTTQAELLLRWLHRRGRRAAWVPNEVGKAIRSALDRWTLATTGTDHARALGLDGAYAVWATAKAAAVLGACAVACEDGALLVADRWTICHLATDRLHGHGHEAFLRDLYAFTPTPLVTIFLDVDPGAAAARTRMRACEPEDEAVLSRYAEAYRALPEFGDVRSVDASRSIEDCHAEIVGIVAAVLHAQEARHAQLA